MAASQVHLLSPSFAPKCLNVSEVDRLISLRFRSVFLRFQILNFPELQKPTDFLNCCLCIRCVLMYLQKNN